MLSRTALAPWPRRRRPAQPGGPAAMGITVAARRLARSTRLAGNARPDRAARLAELTGRPGCDPWPVASGLTMFDDDGCDLIFTAADPRA